MSHAAPEVGDLADGKLWLDRKKLRSRIQMEYEMEFASLQWLNFVALLVCLLSCMANYDPIVQVSNIHNNLRARFHIDTALACASHEDILTYIATFLRSAYEMAPALIDANTMNSIDYARCTDPTVSDICRMTYWYQNPKDAQRNREQVLEDVLSPENSPSILDCPDGGPNCLNRKTQLSSSLRHRTLGISPEDPLIFQSRLDYPIPSIVPLTPVLYQTRAKRKPCAAFGDKYNHQVLGAGRCSVDMTCNPKSVTAYQGTKPARTTKREQTFFATYSEDVFFCVDRKDHADVFYDKSWHPWATHEDLSKGRKTEAVEFNGEKVFYKFISDIAYIQTPIPETVLIPDDPSKTCEGGVPIELPLPPNVGSDPLLNKNHALWSETQDNQIYNDECSLRKLWSKVVNMKGQAGRANSFITLETTDLTISTLILTPQSKEYADVQTLIRVIWRVDQAGTISAREMMQSTSETPTMWFVWVGVVIFLGLVQMSQGISVIYHVCRARFSSGNHSSAKIMQMHRRRALYNGILDVVVSIAAIALMLAYLILELLPPHVSSDLLSSFEANDQDHYFSVFEDIVMYNENLYTLKQCGFVVVCLHFLRFVLYLCLHPRMAVLVNTLIHLGDNFYHFTLYFIFINTILVYLGWWMFAASDNKHYGTFGQTLYTQFQMLTGQFPFPDKSPSFALNVYLLLYTLMVYIILVNFLLAIVVGSYDAVMDDIRKMEIDQNVNIDILDLIRTQLKRRKYRYPAPKAILMALDGDKSDLLDAHSLFQTMAMHQEVSGISFARSRGTNCTSFESIEHAESYLEFYASKLVDSEGKQILVYRSPSECEGPKAHEPVHNVLQAIDTDTTWDQPAEISAVVPAELIDKIDSVMNLVEKLRERQDAFQERQEDLIRLVSQTPPPPSARSCASDTERMMTKTVPQGLVPASNPLLPSLLPPNNYRKLSQEVLDARQEALQERQEDLIRLVPQPPPPLSARSWASDTERMMTKTLPQGLVPASNPLAPLLPPDNFRKLSQEVLDANASWTTLSARSVPSSTTTLQGEVFWPMRKSRRPISTPRQTVAKNDESFGEI